MFVCIYYECAHICVYVSVCVSKIHLHNFTLLQQKGWLKYMIYHDARTRRLRQLLDT